MITNSTKQTRKEYNKATSSPFFGESCSFRSQDHVKKLQEAIIKKNQINRTSLPDAEEEQVARMAAYNITNNLSSHIYDNPHFRQSNGGHIHIVQDDAGSLHWTSFPSLSEDETYLVTIHVDLDKLLRKEKCFEVKEVLEQDTKNQHKHRRRYSKTAEFKRFSKILARALCLVQSKVVTIKKAYSSAIALDYDSPVWTRSQFDLPRIPVNRLNPHEIYTTSHQNDNSSLSSEETQVNTYPVPRLVHTSLNLAVPELSHQILFGKSLQLVQDSSSPKIHGKSLSDMSFTAFLAKIYNNVTFLMLVDACHHRDWPAASLATQNGVLGLTLHCEKFLLQKGISSNTQAFAGALVKGANCANQQVFQGHENYLRRNPRAAHFAHESQSSSGVALLAGFVLHPESSPAASSISSSISSSDLTPTPTSARCRPPPPEYPYVAVFLTLGDNKLYRFSQRTGKITDLTSNNNVQKDQESCPDSQDETRLSRLIVSAIDEGDVLILLTDAVHNTLDGEENSVNTNNNAEKNVMSAKETREKDLMKCETLERLLLRRNISPASCLPSDISEALLDNCRLYGRKLSRSKLNRTSSFSSDRVNPPAKLDHSTCLVYRITHTSWPMKITHTSATNNSHQLNLNTFDNHSQQYLSSSLPAQQSSMSPSTSSSPSPTTSPRSYMVHNETPVIPRPTPPQRPNRPTNKLTLSGTIPSITVDLPIGEKLSNQKKLLEASMKDPSEGPPHPVLHRLFYLQTVLDSEDRERELLDILILRKQEIAELSIQLRTLETAASHK